MAHVLLDLDPDPLHARLDGDLDDPRLGFGFLAAHGADVAVPLDPGLGGLVDAGDLVEAQPLL